MYIQSRHLFYCSTLTHSICYCRDVWNPYWTTKPWWLTSLALMWLMLPFLMREQQQLKPLGSATGSIREKGTLVLFKHLFLFQKFLYFCTWVYVLCIYITCLVWSCSFFFLSHWRFDKCILVGYKIWESFQVFAIEQTSPSNHQLCRNKE